MLKLRLRYYWRLWGVLEHVCLSKIGYALDSPIRDRVLSLMDTVRHTQWHSQNFFSAGSFNKPLSILCNKKKCKEENGSLIPLDPTCYCFLWILTGQFYILPHFHFYYTISLNFKLSGVDRPITHHVVLSFLLTQTHLKF